MGTSIVLVVVVVDLRWWQPRIFLHLYSTCLKGRGQKWLYPLRYSYVYASVRSHNDDVILLEPIPLSKTDILCVCVFLAHAYKAVRGNQHGEMGANICGANNSLVFHAVQIVLFRLLLLVFLFSCCFLSSLLYCHCCCKRERWITITTIHHRIIRARLVLCLVVHHDIIILKHHMLIVHSIDNDYFIEQSQLVHLVRLRIYFYFYFLLKNYKYIS